MVCQKDPLEERTANHPVFSCPEEYHGQRAWQAKVQGCEESDRTEALGPAHTDTDKNFCSKHFEEVVEMGQNADCTTGWL